MCFCGGIAGCGAADRLWDRAGPGVSHHADGDDRRHLEYMAPEQTLRAPRLGPETDIYAAGCVLFECLTGRPPFVASGVQALFEQIKQQPPPDLSEFIVDVPPGLQQLVAHTGQDASRANSQCRCAFASAGFAGGSGAIGGGNRAGVFEREDAADLVPAEGEQGDPVEVAGRLAAALDAHARDPRRRSGFRPAGSSAPRRTLARRRRLGG